MLGCIEFGIRWRVINDDVAEFVVDEMRLGYDCCCAVVVAEIMVPGAIVAR